MNQFKLRRSALYTPGSNPAILSKAARSPADVLIFDLEDAVAPEAKEEARDTVVRALRDPSLEGRTVVVRVNGLETSWCEKDVHAIARSAPTGVLFPKINSQMDVNVADTMLRSFGLSCATELWCMVETPRAILNAQTIAQAGCQPGSRMTTWVLGTNDLVKELRGQHTPAREGLVPMLSIALAAARAGGLCVLDGVHNDVKDAAGFEFTCTQGRQMGFDGRTLIHPNQIETCNRIYSPTAHEVLEAQAVLEAFSRPENQGKGVLQVQGRMVELLHAEVARQTLAVMAAIEQSGSRIAGA
jgi:citrate lyase subunit beta/citryl-CoA lyase